MAAVDRSAVEEVTIMLSKHLSVVLLTHLFFFILVNCSLYAACSLFLFVMTCECIVYFLVMYNRKLLKQLCSMLLNNVHNQSCLAF